MLKTPAPAQAALPALIRAARAGSSPAYGELLAFVTKLAKSVAWKHRRSDEDRDDLVSIVMIKLVEGAIDQLPETAPAASAYLRRMLENLCNDDSRKKTRRNRGSKKAPAGARDKEPINTDEALRRHEQTAAEDSTPEDELIAKQMLVAFANQFNERDQRLLWLMAEGRSPAECAEQLGMTENAASVAIHRLKARLKVLLAALAQPATARAVKATAGGAASPGGRASRCVSGGESRRLRGRRAGGLPPSNPLDQGVPVKLASGSISLSKLHSLAARDPSGAAIHGTSPDGRQFAQEVSRLCDGIDDTPGIYVWLADDGGVVYVGKAGTGVTGYALKGRIQETINEERVAFWAEALGADAAIGAAHRHYRIKETGNEAGRRHFARAVRKAPATTVVWVALPPGAPVAEIEAALIERFKPVANRQRPQGVQPPAELLDAALAGLRKALPERLAARIC